jgi:predicted nuclease of restriction endonuclease-like (RecB) superfamily
MNCYESRKPPSRRTTPTLIHSLMNFEQLILLCRETHSTIQGRACRAVDTALVVRNWFFGWYVVEYEQRGGDRAEYGSSVIKRLSEALTQQIGKGFSPRSLEQARRFYLTFRDIPQTPSAESPPGNSPARITQTLSAELAEDGVFALPSPAEWNLVLPSISRRFPLGWSHYVELLTIDSADERRFYEIEAAANQWSVRELQRQIASSLYERLALSRDKEEIRRLATDGQLVEKAADLIKNPLVLEFLGLDESPHYSEAELESAIINQLESFLLELGKGFLFEARQKRFTFDNDHFFVDLVFYNRLLRCYVLIDLKRDKLTHQDLGQMQMYVNYFDRHVKLPDELPTIGIVLCHRKNDALVELTLPEDANIFASKYQLYLPSKEELKARLEQITHEIERNADE